MNSAFSVSQIKPTFTVFSQIKVQLWFGTSAAFSVLHVHPTNHTNAFYCDSRLWFFEIIDPKLHCACAVFHEIDTHSTTLRNSPLSLSL
jgi:hypothetical protein